MNGRTEMAIRLYDDHVFRGVTFADFNREGAPMILINASDLVDGGITGKLGLGAFYEIIEASGSYIFYHC